jgi:hypothetical protein
MGFSGGGANVTKAHQHDSTVLQDGGALAANATQFGLTSGSMLYSDGTNIQEIGIGNTGDVLGTASGTIPTWTAAAPASGGAWSFVEAFTLGSDNADWTISPSTAMDLEAYEEFMIKIMLEPIAPEGDLSIQINGDTSAAYMVEAVDVDETTVSGISNDGQTSSSIITNCSPGRPVRLEISWIYSPAAGDTAQMGRYYCSAGDQRMSQGFFALSDVLTEISELKIRMSAGTIKAIGATAKLYRLSLS